MSPESAWRRAIDQSLPHGQLPADRTGPQSQAGARTVLLSLSDTETLASRVVVIGYR